jgi:hypothetical protein
MAQSADLMFPNAIYVISAAEWQFWMDPNYRTTMPDVLHEFARGAQRDLSAVKDRVTLVKQGDDIVSVLWVLDRQGTPLGTSRSSLPEAKA